MTRIGLTLRAWAGRGLVTVGSRLFALGADWIAQAERGRGLAPDAGAQPLLQEIKDLLRTVRHFASV